MLVHGGFRYPGPWWHEAAFVEAALTAIEAMEPTMRRISEVSTFEYGLAEHVLPDLRTIWPARRWFRAVAWVGDSAQYPARAEALLAWAAAHRWTALTAADMVPLLTHARADLRLWAQLQLAQCASPPARRRRPPKA